MQLEALIGGHPHTCGPGLTLAEVSRAMHAAGVGSIGVVEGGDLAGILTERDILRAIASGADPNADVVEGWMSTPVRTFDPETSVDDAALRLLEKNHRHLPVVSDGRLIAILSIRDVLAALIEPERDARELKR